jgi:hypothetical protein
MIAEGKLPVLKVGGKLVRIMFDDVEAFENSGGTRLETSPRPSTYVQRTRSTASSMKLPVREEDAYEEAMRLATQKKAKPKKR